MEVICTSKYYSFSQDSKQKRFLIDFGQKEVRLTFCQLLALRHKMNSMNIADHFDGHSNPQGIEFLSLCNKEHFFVLNTLEVLDLKELVQQAFCLLGYHTELKSILAY